MANQSSVRALERGLEIIRLMNRHNGLTVTQIGRYSNLPRPTAFRLLRTLESLGYLFRDKRDKKYRLSSQVRTLSHGYDQEEWIPKVARPIMEVLCRKTLWPFSLGTISGSQILIRETTDSLSPFALNRLSGGFNISLLNSGSGAVYLAFCDSTKRDELLRYSLIEDPDALSRNGTNIEIYRRSLDIIRRDGYACVPIYKDHNNNVMSFPVLVDGEVFAILSMRFFVSALSHQQAIERFSEEIGLASKEMGEKISQWKACLNENP